MKKYLRPLCTALVLTLLAGAAYAASAGDSLVSLSYLREAFFPSAVRAGEDAANQALQKTYDNALGQLDAAHAGLSSGEGGGGRVSDTLEPRLWSDGEVISLPTGSGFLLLEGAAGVTHAGAVIDVTGGTELASGGKLTAGHRYLVGEDTAASVTIRSGQALLGVQGGYGLTPGLERHTPFYDVSQDVWYYKPVSFVYERGLFSGVDAHHFSPAGQMNRAMLVSVLYRLAGSPPQAETAAFSDVPAGQWYSKAVSWGAEQGITSGVRVDSFAPVLQVTREQAVVMLYNYTTKYLKKGAGEGADLSGYADGASVSQWARDSMVWAVGQGIVSGSSNGGVLALAPQRGISRAEMASMLRVFCEKIL